MTQASNLAKHGQPDSLETHALNIAVALASAYRRGMVDALELKRGEDKAHVWAASRAEYLRTPRNVWDEGIPF